MALFKKDGQPQTELQYQIGGMEYPTVVRSLDRMARDGLIERHPSESNHVKRLFGRRKNPVSFIFRAFNQQVKIDILKYPMNKSGGFSPHSSKMDIK